MADPLFWLALSFLLVVISLTAVLVVAIPALRELGRAARSAEKFFDTLGRELPPTLEAIRLTGLEITELTDDVTEGVQGASQVVQQVNQSLGTAQTGAKRLNTGTRSFWAGARAAWNTLTSDAPAQSAPGRSPARPNPTAPSLAKAPETAHDYRLNPSQPLADLSEPTQRENQLDTQAEIPDETRHTQAEPWPEATTPAPEALDPEPTLLRSRFIADDRRRDRD